MSPAIVGTRHSAPATSAAAMIQNLVLNAFGISPPFAGR
jgi:hypothetical protein